jgi:transcriptional regulator with XRE-family HTH domain
MKQTDSSSAKHIIATNIKKYRGKLRLTQDRASEKAGLTVAYWQRLELLSQSDLPSIPALFKIAKALDINPYQLLKE